VIRRGFCFGVGQSSRSYITVLHHGLASRSYITVLHHGVLGWCRQNGCVIVVCVHAIGRECEDRVSVRRVEEAVVGEAVGGQGLCQHGVAGHRSQFCCFSMLSEG